MPASIGLESRGMYINRRLIGTILLPTLLIQTGTTMGNTFIPLYARGLGSSMSMAALITALMFFGQALADFPSGYLVHRFGDRKVMLSGMILALGALLLRMALPALPALVASIFIYGFGASFIWTSRMSWMKREVRGPERGRVMSSVGGSLRMANLAAPLAGGFIAEHLGYTALFGVQTLLVAAALVTVFFAMPASGPQKVDYRESVGKARGTWRERRGTILAAALGIGGLTVLRASRSILFPLWGGELELGESLIGIAMGTGAVVDAGLFWMSGVIMTRWGRKAAAIICTTGMGLAIGLLPLADSMAALTALSVLAGIGNAMGAGINLTVSGDLAPRKAPEFFLSAWRFVMGFAGFAGPALAAWIIRSLSPSAAPPAVGAAGLAGALVMVIFMRETRRP